MTAVERGGATEENGEDNPQAYSFTTARTKEYFKIGKQPNRLQHHQILSALSDPPCFCLLPSSLLPHSPPFLLCFRETDLKLSSDKTLSIIMTTGKPETLQHRTNLMNILTENVNCTKVKHSHP